MVIHCHTVGPEPSAFDVSRAIRGTGAGARSSVGGAGGAGGGRMKRCASCVVSVHKLLWIGGDGGGAFASVLRRYELGVLVQTICADRGRTRPLLAWPLVAT
jgi:hypothetical protein